MGVNNSGKNKSRKIKPAQHITSILIIIIVFIIITVIVVAVFSLSFLHFLPKSTETLTQLNVPIVTVHNSTNSFVLPAYKYQIFEIPIIGSSSSNYIVTGFTYIVTGNSSVNVALMNEAQFNAFNISKNLENNILLQNGTYIKNEFISNSSGENYYLIVFTDRNVSSVNVKVNSVNYSESGQEYPGFFGITNKSGYSTLLPITTNGSGGKLFIYAIANSSFNLEIYDDSNNSIVFYSPKITATNVSNNSSIYALNLGKGKYVLDIINSGNSPLLLFTDYIYIPKNVDPLVYNMSSYARGLAAYGIENNSGKITDYSISAPALMGFADINSLYSYYSSQLGQSHQISLQLNGVLVVKNSNNNTFTYWVQDVANINSQDRVINFENNVWNYSYYSPTPFVLNNQSIVGNGAVYTDTNNQDFYVYSTNKSYFNYPLSFALIESASVENNSGVNIKTCYQPLQGNIYNSSVLNQEMGCYDNITIKDPNAEYAYFYVSGDQYPNFETPPFYDAEFVLGGGYNGSHSVVQSLNAKLGLYYYNESTTSYVQFPSYYPIGADTGETADNVNIKYNGVYASATAGTDNINYLSKC